MSLTKGIHRGRIRSCTWFYCSIIAFMLWIVTTVMGYGTGDIRENLREFFTGGGIIARIFDIDQGNPAPSVELKVTSAPWCAPCRILKPTLEKLKKEGYNITIISTNNPGRAVPALDFYKFGKLETTTFGTKTEAELREIFASIEETVFQR